MCPDSQGAGQSPSRTFLPGHWHCQCPKPCENQQAEIGGLAVAGAEQRAITFAVSMQHKILHISTHSYRGTTLQSSHRLRLANIMFSWAGRISYKGRRSTHGTRIIRAFHTRMRRYTGYAITPIGYTALRSTNA